MQSIIKIILVMTAILIVLTGLSACSSAPTEPATPEAAQLPSLGPSPPQEQGAVETPGTPAPKEEPAPETPSEPEVGPQVGKLAPVFMFTDSGGKNVSLSDLRGRSVMLNFWATWCGPCKYEMPLIHELARDKEKAAKGLVLLTVNGGESADKVTKFMKEHGFSFPVLLDTQRGVSRAYNVRAIPTTFFIDRDGIIRDIKVGAFTTETELDSIINNILD